MSAKNPQGLTQITPAMRKEFTEKCLQWFDSLPDDDARDWAEALLHAAMDETHGDLLRSLEVAQASYAAGPPKS